MIGLYCVLVKKNLVKIIIGMAVMVYAVNLFFIMVGYRTNGQAPIISPQDLAGKNEVTKAFMNTTVDPLPQALVLTSIVIGLGSLALMISLCVRIYEKYGTFDITEIRRLRG